MIKKIKVFESGDYPQGIFDKNRVSEIFSNIKGKINGIFVHSSKWKKENKKPLNIGDFDNFELKENGDKTEVYANIDFNDKGLKYYNDGILKGVSVEITKDNRLDKIAVLPIGTNPAIAGAEFEKEDTVFLLEFEEMKEGKELTREEVLSTLTKEELEKVKIDGYDIEIKEHIEPKTKTEEEIRQEIKAEFEKERAVEKEVVEFMNTNVKKITPAMQKILTNENLKTIFSSDDVIEFQENKLNLKEFFINVFDSMPDLIKTNKTEFEKPEDTKEETIADIMNRNAEETKKRYII